MTVTVPSDHDSSRRFDVKRVGGDEPGSLADDVATEEPLEIRLGYTGPDGEREQKSISVRCVRRGTTTSWRRASCSPKE
jgi:hypothetical protein